MTRIDFYILSTPSAQSRQLTACRLAEKAYSMDHTIYIHTRDREQASHLDNLLWTFRAGSFLPHEQHGEAVNETVPIIIGHDNEPEYHNQVLINLDDNVPMFFSRFERVAEIIGADEESRAAGRERFRFYRERGYDLQTHNLSG